MGRKKNWVIRCVRGEVEEYQLKPSHRHLDFADDIVLLSEKIEQAKRLLHEVEGECKKVGLKLNAKKAKAMFFHL